MKEYIYSRTKGFTIYKFMGIKRILGIAIIISMICLNLKVIAAEPLITVRCDPGSYVVMVSGSYAKAANQVLTITAAKAGVSLNTVDDSNVQASLATFGQAVVNNDGKYEYSFSMGAGWSKGLYTLYINCDNNITSKDFVYSRPEDGGAALAVINADLEALQSNLEKYQYELLLDFTDYNSLTNSERQAVAGSVALLFPEGGFPNVASVNKAFNQSVGLVLFNKAVQAQIPDLMNSYAEYLQFDVGEYEGLSSEQKKYFNDFICKGRYDTVADLKDGISTGIPISILSKAAKYDVIELALKETYKDLFSVDFSGDYQRVQDKSGIFKKMIKSYSTIDDVRRAFTAAVKAQLEYENRQPDSPNGGSGPSSQKNTPIGAAPVNQQPTQDLSPTTTPTPPIEYFSDLDSVAWAKDSIISLAGKGIIAESENKMFMPQENITRAQFVKMIVLSLGVLDIDAVSDFIDVPQDSWMYPYISSAYRLGIVVGDGNGGVGAFDNIVRQDMAVIIQRSLEAVNIELESIEDIAAFDDNEEIEDYARQSVAYVKAHGLMSGVGENRFAPRSPATRAEAAVLIHRLLVSMDRLMGDI